MKKFTLNSHILYTGSGSLPTIESKLLCSSSVVAWISETEIEAYTWKDGRFY